MTYNIGLARLGAESATQEESSAARPWIRYWARDIDMFLFGGITGIALAFIPIDFRHLLPPGTPEVVRLLLSIVLLLGVWVLIEAMLMSTWGTTLGKALLRITVRNKDGSKLSYSQALTRSLWVAVEGSGLGLPYIHQITPLIGYWKLTKNGTTSWDAKGEWVVKTHPIGKSRIICAIMLVVIYHLLSL